MKRLSITPQRLIGSDQRTPGAQPNGNCEAQPKAQAKAINPAILRAVDRLTDFYGILDVADPQSFMAGIAAIFAKYPLEVVEAAIDPASGIPVRCQTLKLFDIDRICKELYEPIERRIERERAAQSHMRGLPPPMETPTPESRERVVTMAEQAKELLGPPLKKNERAKGPVAFEIYGEVRERLQDRDGKHAQRVQTELAERARWREGQITP